MKAANKIMYLIDWLLYPTVLNLPSKRRF